MHNNFPLDNYFRSYARGEMEKRELEGKIFEFILENHRSFHLARWSKDDCIDYLCWLYPRLTRAIDNYRYAGSSFDAYIGSMVRLTAREFRLMETDHGIVERTYWDYATWEDTVCDEEPEFSESEFEVTPVNNPRQVLILLLKSYSKISEEFLERVAPALGIGKERLMKLIEDIRAMRFEQESAMRSLIERIHTQYYRVITYEKKALAVTPFSNRYEMLKKRQERAFKVLQQLRIRLKTMRSTATNLQIARALGVPKGTVDSNLHAAKAKIRRLKEGFAEKPDP